MAKVRMVYTVPKKNSIPTDGSVFRGPTYPLGCVATGLPLLPVRRAVCRSTKLKCCDCVPEAVSRPMQRFARRDEAQAKARSIDAVCRQNALLTSSCEQ